MKTIKLFTLSFLAFCLWNIQISIAQNTYPPIGNMGLGILVPTTPLEIRQNPDLDRGIKITMPGKNSIIALHLASGLGKDYGYLSLGGFTKLRGNGQASSFQGRLGIQTATPAQELDIHANSSTSEVLISSARHDSYLKLFTKRTNLRDHMHSGSGSGNQGWALVGRHLDQNHSFAGDFQIAYKGANGWKEHFTIKNEGGVGVGTRNPLTSFDVQSANFTVARMYRPGGNGATIKFQNDEGSVFVGIGAREEIYFGQSNNTFMAFTKNGRLGLGTFTPNQELSIKAARPRIALSDSLGDAGIIEFHETTNQIRFQYWQEDGKRFKKNMMTIDGNKDAVGIGTTNIANGFKLDVRGKAIVDVLTIRGGADLAEPFPISNETILPEGSVVVIDPQNPGNLTISTQAYDKKVAGIISGANGVNPGLVLQQENVLDEGQHIALSGRVYVRANNSNGTIEPGDMLTTSGISGEAMKVSEYEKAQGAIIGKAMTTLENGYVLVLVSLQ